VQVFAIIGTLIAVIAIGGKIAFARIEKNLAGLKDLPIERVDVSRLADGDYPGAYKAFPVEVELVARVRGGRIAGIDLIKHSNGKGKAAESLLPLVVEKQDIGLDAVSGATYSSKVILKAIEDALKKARAGAKTGS